MIRQPHAALSFYSIAHRALLAISRLKSSRDAPTVENLLTPVCGTEVTSDAPW
jgi:hypothetical protein